MYSIKLEEDEINEINHRSEGHKAMRVKLKGVQETLLIPLIAKADETKSKNGKIHDTKAVELVSKIDYDFSKFENTMSMKGVIARTIVLDREVGKYFQEYPDAVCISIGCGLDTRYQRLRPKKVQWYNLDFPEVIILRKNLLYEGKNVHFILKSALETSWLEDIPKDSEHVLIILEGILMYFTEADVIQLLSMFHNYFKECTILAEIMHPSMVKQVKHHDTVKKTNAVFKWGVKSGKEMEKLCQDMSCIHEWNIADEMTDMGILYRLIGKIPFLYHRWEKIVELKLHNEYIENQ